MFFRKNNSIKSEEIIIDSVPEKDGSALRIMSFNLRSMDDKEGSIAERSKIALEVIRQYAPDSLGTQEATGLWMDILTNALSDRYAYVGKPRDTRGKNTEYNTIFYLKDKFDLVDSGTIWLSETPEKEFTKSYNSNCFRIATWAVLSDKKTGESFTHLNTHLDHILEETRVCQVKVLIEKLKELQKKNKVFCTGDFNTTPKSEVYASMTELTDDSRSVAVKSDRGNTFHGYGKMSEEKDCIIDYVFVSRGAKVDTFKIIRNTVKGMYPSDHYPIIADIIKEEA